MTAWVVLDADGRVTGGREYPPERQREVPAGAVPLPEGARIAALVGQRWTGAAWVHDPLPDLAPEPPEAVAAGALARARVRARERVDAEIGAARLRFITDLPGQEMIYLRKEREAIAYLAAPEPDLAAHRFVRTDAQRFGITGHEAAQIILNLAQMFELLADGMEAIRGAAHDALDAAGEVEATEAATAAAREDLFLLLSSHGGVAVAAPQPLPGPDDA